MVGKEILPTIFFVEITERIATIVNNKLSILKPIR
jgi:hypothetical protein